MHDLLISNQVAKGFELLGNKEKDITLRLGGIYAFEDVMNTSEENHKPVLEGLNAFVRENILGHQRQEPPPSRAGRMSGVTSILLCSGLGCHGIFRPTFGTWQ